MFLFFTNNSDLNYVIFILLCILSVVLIIYLILFAISVMVFKRSFVRAKTFLKGKKSEKWQKYKNEIDASWEKLDKLEKEDIYLSGYKNKKIHATFIKSNTGSKKVILFSHGWKNMGLNDYACAGMYYHEKGYNVLVVDHLAHGESEGKYITFGLNDKENILKWVDYINNLFESDCEIYMHGLSMGSSTICYMAKYDMKNVKGIIADSGFMDGYELAKHIVSSRFKFLPSVILFNVRILCMLIAHFDIKKCNTKESLIKSKYPILFMHGDSDNFVPTIHSINSYEACNSEKSIVLFDRSAHIIACLMHKEKYQNTVLEFIEKH